MLKMRVVIRVHVKFLKRLEEEELKEVEVELLIEIGGLKEEEEEVAGFMRRQEVEVGS